MRIIKQCRIHKAVLWRSLGDTGRGYLAYSTPEEVKCRWDDLESTQFQEDGTSFRCWAELVMDRRVAVGDLLIRGELADLKGDIFDPQSLPNIGVVRRVEISPTLRNKDITNYNKTAVIVYLGNRYGG